MMLERLSSALVLTTLQQQLLLVANLTSLARIFISPLLRIQALHQQLLLVPPMLNGLEDPFSRFWLVYVLSNLPFFSGRKADDLKCSPQENLNQQTQAKGKHPCVDNPISSASATTDFRLDSLAYAYAYGALEKKYYNEFWHQMYWEEGRIITEVVYQPRFAKHSKKQQ